MRVLLFSVAVVLVGCPPPPPICLCQGPEEVQLVGQVDGVLTTIANGSTVNLEPVVPGCGRKTNFSLRNPGRVPLTVAAKVDSSNIVILNAPTVLFPGQSASLVVVARTDEPVNFISAALTLTAEGNLPLQQFTLRAQVNEPDAQLARTMDFGGVQIGTRRSLTGPLVSGLTGDFQPVGSTVEFAPRDVGRQQLVTTYEGLVDCPSLNTVTLVGDGVLSVLTGPVAIDFGGVAVGSTAELAVDLGNYSVEGISAELSAVGSPSYAIVTQPRDEGASRDASGLLVPSTSRVTVRFSPASQGAVLQELAVVSGAHTLLIPVRGTGL